MSVDHRLTNHPYLAIDRGRTVFFRVNGKPLSAHEGETIGAALHAAGVKIFSRSVKYHRPRGLFCLAGNCANCLLQVDGVPNVRACIEPVRDGMEVQTQTGWPSPQVDLFSLLDTVGFLFPVGFPYRYFIRPRWLYHWWEKLLRHMSGHGTLSVTPTGNGWQANGKKIDVETDIAVIGAGPAGLAAARAATATGAQVMLIDEGPHLGGSLRTDSSRYSQPRKYRGLRGYEIAEKLAITVSSRASLQACTGAIAFGIYDDGVIGIRQHETLLKLTAQRVVIATGAYENPLIAEDWDRPGVFLATGVQRMLHLWRMRPGRVATVVTTNDLGFVVAAQLVEAGVEVRAVADVRTWINEKREEVTLLKERGVPLLTSHTLKAVHGRMGVTAVSLGRVNSDGQFMSGTDLQLSCDTVVLAGGFSPANELLFQATSQGSYVLEAADILTRVPYRAADMQVQEGVYVAGHAAGIGDPFDLTRVLWEGEIAGLSAALSLGLGGPRAETRRDRIQQSLAARRGN
jgi:sarcosine oxidase subunit alpha